MIHSSVFFFCWFWVIFLVCVVGYGTSHILEILDCYCSLESVEFCSCMQLIHCRVTFMLGTLVPGYVWISLFWFFPLIVGWILWSFYSYVLALFAAVSVESLTWRSLHSKLYLLALGSCWNPVSFFKLWLLFSLGSLESCPFWCNFCVSQWFEVSLSTVFQVSHL